MADCSTFFAVFFAPRFTAHLLADRMLFVGPSRSVISRMWIFLSLVILGIADDSLRHVALLSVLGDGDVPEDPLMYGRFRPGSERSVPDDQPGLSAQRTC